ncbi:PPA1309 family protein [Acidipropionibacterium thoenii]|uniref:PPA1309 family protein n=1 Tax=Acidipropionibacterium thoenii TaxID=1751 RepID=UPI00068828D2
MLDTTPRCPEGTPAGSTPDDSVLVAALTEIDRFLGTEAWGQPARLFALVPTCELVAAEPSLAGQLAAGSPDSLSSIEQEGFVAGDHLEQALASIAWPATVHGAAISVERTFLPAQEEAGIPEDPEQAAAYVAAHPRRQDLRLVCGAMRNGVHYGVARVLDHPDDLLGGSDLAPSLEAALLATLNDEGPTGDRPGTDTTEGGPQ